MSGIASQGPRPVFSCRWVDGISVGALDLKRFLHAGVLIVLSDPAVLMPMKTLVLEDDAAVASYVRICLEDDGHEVVDVATPEAALQAIEQGSAFDLLVTDLHLGTHVDGVHVASELIERLPSIAVVVLTGMPFQARKRMATFNSGVILPKPFTSADLFQAVDLAMEQSESKTANPPH